MSLLPRRLFAVPLIGLVFALSAPPSVAQPDDGAPAQTFVGPVPEAVESARVGVVADGKNFVLYLCSTDEAFNRSSARWARGAVANGAMEGKSPDGAMTVKATVAADAVKGTLTVGGKALAFTATRADGRTYAGLYRCEEKDGPNDYVAGWVVDEDDFVAGNVQNRQTGRFQVPPGAGRPNAGGAVPGTQQGGGARPPAPGTGGRPQPPRGGNTPPNLNPGTGTGVNGQQVTDPRNPATGVGKKLTPQDLQNQIGVIATNLERAGGSPLLGLTIQQVRRFLSGARPSGPLETKTFARMGRVPRGTLAEYVRNWDALPAATRQRILGPQGGQADPATPLTGEVIRSVLGNRGGPSGAADPNATAAARVSSVRFLQLKCDNPADARKDEIFYTCLVSSGTIAFDNVSDIYKGIKRGDVKNFSARDSQFWPRFNTNAQATSDIAVAVGLYDDDSGIRRVVVDLLTTLGDVAGDISANSGQTGTAVATGFQNFLEGSAAVVGSARFIGADAMVVRPNKQVVGTNNAAKSSLVFTRNGVNDVVYRFQSIQVN
jgi:hypothetical protein